MAVDRREERTVSNSLTLQYDRVVYLLTPNDLTRTLKRKRVNVFDYADGTIAIRCMTKCVKSSRGPLPPTND